MRDTAKKALGRIDAAVSDMDVVLAADRSYCEAYLERGKLSYLQQYWEQAVADLTMAIEHLADGAPNVRDCFYWRGVSTQERGEHLEAIGDFARAIEMAPNDATAYMRRSRSYNEIRELALAAADL